MSDSKINALSTITPPVSVRLYQLRRFIWMILCAFEFQIFLFCAVLEYLYVWKYNSNLVRASSLNADYSPLVMSIPPIGITLVIPIVYLFATLVIGRGQNHIVSTKQLLKSIVDHCKSLRNGLMVRGNVKSEFLEQIERFPEILRLVLIHYEYSNKFTISNGYNNPKTNDSPIFVELTQTERSAIGNDGSPSTLVEKFKNDLRKNVLPLRLRDHENTPIMGSQTNVIDEYYNENIRHLNNIIEQSNAVINIEPEQTGSSTFIGCMVAIYIILLSCPVILLSYLSWFWGGVYSLGISIVLIGVIEGGRTRNLTNELSINIQNYEWYIVWKDKIRHLTEIIKKSD